MRFYESFLVSYRVELVLYDILLSFVQSQSLHSAQQPVHPDVSQIVVLQRGLAISVTVSEPVSCFKPAVSLLQQDDSFRIGTHDQIVAVGPLGEMVYA